MAKRNKFEKLCKLSAYAVAIRRKGTNEGFLIKYPTWKYWYADPFVVGYQGKEYIFVEIMNSYKIYGEIAVAPIENDKIGDFSVTISEKFHLSFPNVFCFNGEWYMIPESNAVRQVRLYHATEFPYKWELDKILLNDVRLVDHALFPKDSGYLVLSNDIENEEKSYNRFFSLDMKKKEMNELELQGTWSNMRPGGTFYRKKDEWHHVYQDGIRVYGEYIHVFKVEINDEKFFKEEEIKQIHVNDLDYKNSNGKFDNIHTYNCDDIYEVIDLQYKRIYPHKMTMHWWREYLKHNK